MPSAPRTRFISVEGVDPSVVPSRTLSSGARIPAIGLGTFGSDHVTHSEVADAVRYAVSLGYRHFDCASVYGNEDRIGRMLKGIFAEGLRRDQVWFTEKNNDGASHLYPLSDFKPRKEENLQSGYLQGRYGAIPFINPDAFLARLEDGNEQA